MIALFSIVAITLVSGICIYYVYSTNESVKNRYYMLDNGQKLSTVRIKDFSKAVDILCEGHLENFHELFFAIEPDMRYIKRNIEEKALYMIDNSGPKLFNQLMDSKYYEGVVYSKYSIGIEIDSIVVNYTRYPYPFDFYGKQKIQKDSDVKYRNLITKGFLRETAVTPNNLNGLIIEKFVVVDNNDIK
jgi:conjugative transposon TraK protein